jgi:hypothetical protein
MCDRSRQEEENRKKARLRKRKVERPVLPPVQLTFHRLSHHIAASTPGSTQGICVTPHPESLLGVKVKAERQPREQPATCLLPFAKGGVSP